MASVESTVGSSSPSSSSSPAPKRPRLSSDPAGDERVTTLPSVRSILASLEPRRILRQDPERKLLWLEGAVGGQKAILLLEKSPFGLEQQGKEQLKVLDELVRNSLLEGWKEDQETQPDQTSSTDQDESFRSVLLPVKGHPFNVVKSTLIYPATDAHIAKYSESKSFLINETPKLYADVTLPVVNKQAPKIQWVRNILNHKSESERIVFEDPDPAVGFILLPDLKWDGILKDTLYLVAIVHREGIRSLRDLTPEHLPLLENVKDKGTKAICDKYGLRSSQLRICLHYQPTYYHLHLHFTYLNFDAPGIDATKSHLLSTVMRNINLVPDYYQRSTIPFVVYEGTALYHKYVEAGHLFKDDTSDRTDQD